MGARMKQATFSDAEYAQRKRKGKREHFLHSMEGIIPWGEWEEMIRPYYPKGEHGRPPVGIKKMLRMYLLQIWFNLSDEGMEEAIYDSYAFRQFMGVDFTGSQQVPDATTLLKFRHMLEKNGLGGKIFADVKSRLERAGLMMQGGTIVDATLINAPTSTKNKTGKRDPEMHSVKKGNQWYFGMKAHIGTDAGSGYVHTVTATTGSTHDVAQAHELIRPGDEVVYGDSGYLGIEKREEVRRDGHLSTIEYRINKRPTSLKAKPDNGGCNWDREIERRKSGVRSKVEHPFLIVKKQFGYAKAAYKGLSKNLHRLEMLFASANLLMCVRAGRQEDFISA